MHSISSVSRRPDRQRAKQGADDVAPKMSATNTSNLFWRPLVFPKFTRVPQEGAGAGAGVGMLRSGGIPWNENKTIRSFQFSKTQIFKVSDFQTIKKFQIDQSLKFQKHAISKFLSFIFSKLHGFNASNFRKLI